MCVLHSPWVQSFRHSSVLCARPCGVHIGAYRVSKARLCLQGTRAFSMVETWDTGEWTTACRPGYPTDAEARGLKVVASHPEKPNNTLSQKNFIKKIFKKKKGEKSAHPQTTGLTRSPLEHLKSLLSRLNRKSTCSPRQKAYIESKCWWVAHTLLSDVDILTLQFKSSGLGVMAHTFSRHAGGRGRQILCKSKANLVYIAQSRPVRLLNLCLKTKNRKGPWDRRIPSSRLTAWATMRPCL